MIRSLANISGETRTTNWIHSQEGWYTYAFRSVREKGKQAKRRGLILQRTRDVIQAGDQKKGARRNENPKMVSRVNLAKLMLIRLRIINSTSVIAHILP